MLLTRISNPFPSNPEPEDIFHSALTTIFTDDAVNSHGTPGSSVTYRSPRFGDISLRIPAHPDAEDGRKLFAHYLWNAAVIAADAIESASSLSEDQESGIEGNLEAYSVSWAEKQFNVRNKRVLELGAGTALPSIISALVGASSCTITDHPSSPALTMGAIEQNVQGNLHIRPERPSDAPSEESSVALRAFESPEDAEEQSQTPVSPQTHTQVLVRSYTWGTPTFYLPSTYGKPAPRPSSAEYFDRILIADCLWMPSQHINLIRTILTFLPRPQTTHQDPRAAQTTHNDPPCALVAAGFHTGRKIVSDFFSLATQPLDSAEPEVPLTSEHATQDGTTAPSSSDTSSTSKASPSPTTPHPSASLPTTNANANTTPLNPLSFAPSERAVCGHLRLALILEVDVDGHTRPWRPEREGEGRWEAKRWCVVAVLVRK